MCLHFGMFGGRTFGDFSLFLFSSQIEELGVEENRTPAYSELVNTVKAARTSNSGAN